MPTPGVCMNIINARRKKNGYGTPTNPERFLNQDYVQLKQYCLAKRVRYVDDMFPPDKRSIGDEVLSPSDLARVEWLRPHKIVNTPSFTVSGVSRFDFGQGMVGQVVPLDQRFDEDYCGLFRFRFWRYGRWVEVIVDDKVPTINGKLIFVHSKDPNEFWPALLEKAYAKVCGSYTDMNAGTPSEALMDFTGVIHICVDLSKPLLDPWELMCRAAQSNSLMACGTPQGETSANTVLPNGLVQGHAYTVTGVKQIICQGKTVNLVRLFNPWGKGEWNGDWSDRSPLWKMARPEDRELCLSAADDGEFWMPVEDFCKFYSDLDICCMCPDFLDEGSECHWKTSVYEGRWVAGTTAGGCMNYPDSFWTNPQYRVTIEKLPSDCAAKQGEKNMFVSLMQKPDKRNRRLVKNLHIGFAIYEDEEYGGKLKASFFRKNSPVAVTKPYLNAREVMELVTLKPGEYLIVPSTFSPNETASFILTIISKSETHVHENSGGHNYEHMEVDEHGPHKNGEDEAEKNRTFFRQFSDKYEEVDAEQLRVILNEKILRGNLKNGGFSSDACRSMVALYDTSITGKLNGEEFIRLSDRIITYKDIFNSMDVSQTGTLSLTELRNALMATGKRINDEMLNLMAVRYGSSSGQMSLENFISLVLRFDCMYQIFGQLSDGMTVTLRESEWMYLSMYT
ncbi:calpain-1 catalytic subunit-like [Xyrichtys novacula]|uniref:Calpain-1 catalytic subunit-like n=1 Tax=Xyrichtys novacula TaxID=13765 RepID=A0AAV1EYT3_XYRNO|nr:calpain-1 catalytic subunit-like [Xyrichtys novacula]